jgi:RNA polymerase sigma-70 factor (ECF subfamily)
VQQVLLDRAKQGDEDAFAALAGPLADRMMAIAYRILRDIGLAEDALQQALVTAWRELPSLKDDGRFEAWLRRILVNDCYAEARDRQRSSANIRLLTTDGPGTPVSPPGSDDIASVADRDQLERGFRRLSHEQRAIFVLFHYVGLSQPEIAAELGLPLGTVKSRLHYAIASLRAALEADARSTSPTRENIA